MFLVIQTASNRTGRRTRGPPNPRSLHRLDQEVAKFRKTCASIGDLAAAIRGVDDEPIGIARQITAAYFP